MVPLSNRSWLLPTVAAIVLVAGVALALAKPGNLADHQAKSAAASTTTAAPAASTTTPSTSAPSTTTTTTAAPTSGLGTTGSGSAGRRGLATTGGLPLALPGAVLLVAAVLSRRLASR